MFRNYFKIAWRNLVKDKMHSLINISGLSIGMAVALLISLWMYDQLSFNKNFDHYDRIASVYQNLDNNGERQTWKEVPYPLANELRTNYGSDFKHIVMAVHLGEHLLTIGDKKIKQTGGYFEKEMPQMFTLKMLEGSRNALNDPSAILISASAAKVYFGDRDPVHQTVIIDKMPPLKVTGVYEDFPHNSTFANLNFVASWDFLYSNSYISKMEDPWRPNFTELFVQLNDQADIKEVRARIKDAKMKKLNAQLQKKKPALFLHPMGKWHLYSEFKNGVNIGGDIQYIWMFGITGAFVLLLACINFMNLSTAKSEKRAKEVGVRKAMGSLRKQLIFQFLRESLMTVSFAFSLSILLVWLSLPFFNEIAGKQIMIPWNSFYFWMMGFSFTIITAFIAGSYPAFYLSSFKPVKVLKGTFKAGRTAAVHRKVLVVIQFSVSIILIIGTIIVYKQVQFAKNRPIGYSRANLITISVSNSSVHDHFDAIKEELLQTGFVSSVAESESPTTAIYNSTSGFSWPEKDPNLSVDFDVLTASYDFGKTIGWQIKEGRNFSKSYATDSFSVILNEAAVQFMNLKNPIGQKVSWWDRHLTVIGVIKNMVVTSPYEEPKPTIFVPLTYTGNISILKLNPNVSTQDALSKIAPIYKRFNPDEPFTYSFVDDDYAKKFNNEEKVGKLAGIFAALTIFISCLGLFGLISFIAEQRKKEIGVRKVLGASALNVWNLLSKDFVMLVVIAFIIAVPVAYYFMHNWLQNFTYRTDISWWIFIAAGIVALLITLITISFQAFRAAVANPVKSLRTE